MALALRKDTAQASETFNEYLSMTVQIKTVSFIIISLRYDGTRMSAEEYWG